LLTSRSFQNVKTKFSLDRPQDALIRQPESIRADPSGGVKKFAKMAEILESAVHGDVEDWSVRCG